MRLFAVILAAAMLLSALSGCSASCLRDGISVETPTEATRETLPNSDLLRPDPFDINTFCLSEMEQSALQTLTDIRSEEGQPALETDITLCALAYIRAKEAFSKFSHTRPDGRNYDTIFAEYGYELLDSAEVIISKDSPLPMENFFDIRELNPDGYQRLTNPAFLRVGIGIYHQNGQDVMVCLLVK